MESVAEVEAAMIERVPLWNDRSHEYGPFDFIGDVHGCADELEVLLNRGASINRCPINDQGKR